MTADLTLNEASLERIPPQSIEAEQAILGSLLVNNETMTKIVSTLDPEFFYRKAHQIVYAAILDLYERNEPIDIVTLSQYLKDQGTLESVGGRQYLTDLALSIATTANAEYYAKTVSEKALLRNLIKAGTEIVSSCYEDTDADLVVDKAERLIFGIAQNRNLQDLTHIRDIVNDSFARIEKRYEERDSLSGIPSGFYDLDALTAGFQPSDLIIVAARPSMGKCLAFDSEILLEDGSIKTIEELYKQRSARLLTLQDNHKFSWTSPSVFVDDGIKPVFEVVTKLGRKIETTITHPFLTINGWKKLGELKAGDFIGMPRRLPATGKDRINDSQVKLLAYLIGDGCVRRKISFTNNNPRLQDEFAQCIAEFDGTSIRLETRPERAVSAFVKADVNFVRGARKSFGNRLRKRLSTAGMTGHQAAAKVGVSTGSISNWLHGRTMPEPNTLDNLARTIDMPMLELVPEGQGASRWSSRNEVALWLDSLGLYGKGSADKFIPELIFRLVPDQVALFLNRLFATDGWSCKYATGQCQIGFCSISERLARQVQHLLLRFGIISKLKLKKVAYKGQTRHAWQVEVTGNESITSFVNNIGIFGKEESVLEVGRQVKSKRKQTNCDLLPMSVWNQIAEAKGNISWSQLSRDCGLSDTNLHVSTRRPSRARLSKFAHALKSESLRALAESDLYWDEIVSIQSNGMKQVYDLTIPETHNFVANDICVHNTALCLNIAQHAAVEHGTPVAIFSLEMSKEQLVQRLLCAEAAIDANKIRSGFLQTNDWTKLAAAMGRLGEAPIYIDDSAVVTALDVRAKARRLKSETKGLGMIIIDYIQLMQGRSKSGSDNRVQEVSEISRGLKTLARELNVPVIALSQLSRAVEQRQNKRPMLSDLRESGCLAGDTLVYLPDEGKSVPIGSLVGQTGFRVMALNTVTWEYEARVVTNAFSTGVKTVHSLTTKSGRTIRATGNHKFLTIDGWKRLDELTVGERIAAPRQRPEEVSTRIRAGKAHEEVRGGVALLERPTKVESELDIYWDEIRSIKKDSKEEVFDLTVDGLHNFIANNITVHNSIEQDADIVMFIYRDDYYNQESERRGEAEIIIAKQRNGPTGTVDLLYQSSITRFLNKAVQNPQYTQP